MYEKGDMATMQHQKLLLRPGILQRYIVYYVKKWWDGVIPLMDYMHPVQSNHQRGIPLGGIGGGTINLSYLGGFGNFQMRPGIYEENIVDAWQFIVNIRDDDGKTVYQQVLNPRGAPDSGYLSSWKWEFPGENGEFRALYPRAWLIIEIPKHNVKLVCRVINPILPARYKDSCIPGCIFEWTIHNNGDYPQTVSIVMTCKNGIGTSDDRHGKTSCIYFSASDTLATRPQYYVGFSRMCGIEMEQTIHDMNAKYCLSTLKSSAVTVSAMTYFDPCGDGSDLWDNLYSHGRLKHVASGKATTTTKVNAEHAAALCVSVSVSPSRSSVIPFSLTWDIPQVKFRDGVNHKRYYTSVFTASTAARDMCVYILRHYSDWENIISVWQYSILDRIDMPQWLKQALFNELYYIADGGTLWLRTDPSEKLPPQDPRKLFGRFAYLEGQEYRMYNTYDVHYYASFALISLWPALQISLQYDFRDAISKEDLTTVWFLYNGKCAPRKVKNTVPHDLGDPDEQPLKLINSYPIHDVSEWKDLNLKFVLQVFRDYCYTTSQDYLRDMYPAVYIVMKYALTWDTDGDCMIENSGLPDQTYDAWVMTGTSAYCGGLWLAALLAFIQMSKALGKTEMVDEFSHILSNAKKSYDRKLWNGKYYNFDCSEGEHSKTIMSDQLCGLWYLRCSGFTEHILPHENVLSALNTIYQSNVLKYFGGKQGAVNGMKPDGTVDQYAIQSEEMWTGVTYALAALLIYEGLRDEGFKTAQGVYETVFNQSGLAFASPEALHGLDSYRSLAYMRPLSVWSMKIALDFLEHQSVD